VTLQSLQKMAGVSAALASLFERLGLDLVFGHASTV
jgi:hypothetical protein